MLPQAPIACISLTDKQARVLEYLIQGYTRKQVAAKENVHQVSISNRLSAAVRHNNTKTVDALLYKLGLLNWYNGQLLSYLNKEYNELG